jgi:hypothetical protein
VRGPIAMRRLEFVTHMAITQQHRRFSESVAQKALQKLLAVADNVTGDVFTGAGVGAATADEINRALSQ